ncbi:hypothetical protein [Clostridium grantii]|uniref:Uncharacterized protein n=1 Tax=Clostridium grantii DSM 8605 TaxID=1121316 RepID=A0A1M5UN54_9CLOT|nr:hypothetical protein [Clostridium grantii]SHH64336.1 hypothetical protein SAMN02745207_01833 [Clostridium grantii DSM 8605]
MKRKIIKTFFISCIIVIQTINVLAADNITYDSKEGILSATYEDWDECKKAGDKVTLKQFGIQSSEDTNEFYLYSTERKENLVLAKYKEKELISTLKRNNITYDSKEGILSATYENWDECKKAGDKVTLKQFGIESGEDTNEFYLYSTERIGKTRKFMAIYKKISPINNLKE